MKFTIDTQKKTLTLLEQTSFKELDAIKKFIGDDWKDWQVAAEKVTITTVERYPAYRPWWYERTLLTQTYATNGLRLNRNNDDHKQYLVECSSQQSLSNMKLNTLLDKNN